MAVIETIKTNLKNGYTQGTFANGFYRQDIYDIAKLVNPYTNNSEETLKIFLTNTLMWGNFDVVVGRYKRTNAKETINSIPDFHFYTEVFLNKMNDEKITIDEKFKLFEKKGELNIKNIGFAYFTKFLHFYSFGNNQISNMLILDKWAIYAWSSLIIELNIENQYELLPKLLRVSNGKISPKNISGELYKEYNLTFLNIAKELNISSNILEELIFGWDLRQERHEFTNPRIEILKILKNKSNLF
jgi:hypothetical protein